MTGLTQKRTTDGVIRAAGALCCTASYLAVGGLAHLRVAAPAAQPGVLAYALAAIAFLGASVGAALVILGHHIFDQVQVSRRWQHRSAQPVSQPRGRGDVDDAPPAGGIDVPIARRAVATATDLPLPWRAPDLAAPRTPDLRIASQW